MIEKLKSMASPLDMMIDKTVHAPFEWWKDRLRELTNYYETPFGTIILKKKAKLLDEKEEVS